MMKWRIRFSDGDIKVGMILSSWNKFLRSLLYVVVKSNNNEGLVRTIHFELGRLRLIVFHLNDKKENKRKNMCKRKKHVQFHL
jgi:hypothetical protein